MAVDLSAEEFEVVSRATALLRLASERLRVEHRPSSSLLHDYTALYVSLMVQVCVCRGDNLLTSTPDDSLDTDSEIDVAAGMEPVQLLEEAHRLLIPLAATCESVPFMEFVAEVGCAGSELRRHVGRA